MSQRASTHVDLAIIGGGLAGVSAALKAGQLGINAAIVMGKPGATALSNGIFDGQPTNAPKTVTCSSLEHVLPIVQRTDKVLRLLDCWGRHFFVQAAQQSQIDGDITPHMKGTSPTPAIGIVQFGYHKASPDPAFHFNEVMACEQFVDVPLSPVSTHPSPFQWAASLDASPEETLAIWTREIEQWQSQHNRLSLLLFPPILGNNTAAERCQTLTEKTGITCAELLATTPSVPGIRLYQALREQVIPTLAPCVAVLEGMASKPSYNDKQLFSCHVGDNIELTAREWIIATGGWLSGGLQKEAFDGVEESFLGLPLLYLADGLPKELNEEDWLQRQREARQPLLSAGVGRDAQDRPADAFGVSLFENVRLTGAVVASDKCLSCSDISKDAERVVAAMAPDATKGEL